MRIVSKLIISIIALASFFSVCFANETIHIFFINVSSKSEISEERFYNSVSELVEELENSEFDLVTRYGVLNGLYIVSTKPGPYPVVEKKIERMEKNEIIFKVDYEEDIPDELSGFYYRGKDFELVENCHLKHDFELKKSNINFKQYFDLLAQYINKRGIMLSYSSKNAGDGQNTKFTVDYKFAFDCNYKKEILNDLFANIRRDHFHLASEFKPIE